MRTAGQILMIVGFAGAIFAFTWLLRGLPGAGVFGVVAVLGFGAGGPLYWAGARRAARRDASTGDGHDGPR